MSIMIFTFPKKTNNLTAFEKITSPHHHTHPLSRRIASTKKKYTSSWTKDDYMRSSITQLATNISSTKAIVPTTATVVDANTVVDSNVVISSWNTVSWSLYLSWSSGYNSLLPWSTTLLFRGPLSYTQKQHYETLLTQTVSQIISLLDIPLRNQLQYITIDGVGRWKRGYAWAQTMVLNLQQITDDREFVQVLTHELWHIIDLGIRVGTSFVLDTVYTEFNQPAFAVDDPSLDFYKLSRQDERTRRPESSYRDFVSGYGLTDPFEDWAETLNMYLRHYDILKLLARDSSILTQKMEILTQLFDRQYIQWDSIHLSLVTSPTWRPWDSTRIK